MSADKQTPSDDTESRIARIVEVGRGSRSSRAIAATIVAALAEAGYKILPREPSEAMLKEAPWPISGEMAAEVWRDLWDVAE